MHYIKAATLLTTIVHLAPEYPPPPPYNNNTIGETSSVHYNAQQMQGAPAFHSQQSSAPAFHLQQSSAPAFHSQPPNAPPFYSQPPMYQPQQAYQTSPWTTLQPPPYHSFQESQWQTFPPHYASQMVNPMVNQQEQVSEAAIGHQTADPIVEEEEQPIDRIVEQQQQQQPIISAVEQEPINHIVEPHSSAPDLQIVNPAMESQVANVIVGSQGEEAPSQGASLLPVNLSNTSGENKGDILRKQIDEFATGKECVVCMEADRDTVVMNCKHFVMCNACAHLVQECPICRAQILDRVKVFYS